MKNNGISISLSSILTIIFVVAKLMGVIDWSWWLVFAPTIIAVSLSVLLLMILLVIAVIADIYSK
jgi:hypothetical protein